MADHPLLHVTLLQPADLPGRSRDLLSGFAEAYQAHTGRALDESVARAWWPHAFPSELSPPRPAAHGMSSA